MSRTGHRLSSFADGSDGTDCPIIGPDGECCRCIGQALDLTAHLSVERLLRADPLLDFRFTLFDLHYNALDVLQLTATLPEDARILHHLRMNAKSMTCINRMKSIISYL